MQLSKKCATIPPPLPRNQGLIGVSWSDWRYQQCLSDNILGRGPLDAYDYCDALRWVAESPFPVGDRGVSVHEPWYGIPQVVPIFTGTKEDLLHEPPPRTLRPSTETELPVIYESWSDWVAAGRTLPNDYHLYPTPATYPDQVPTYVPPTTTQGGSMDLGTLGSNIIDIGLEALRSRVVQQPQSFAPAVVPIARTAAATGAAIAGGAGVAEVIDLAQARRKKRRRRRRLATVSDIKDLAALKAVLGNGEAFKTWIATHSR